VRVLVTGASGHIGGAVARALIDEGHEVVGLSRRWAKIPGLAHTHMVDIGVPGLAGRIGEQRCDAIVHAAASMAIDPSHPSLSLVNALGTQQVLALAEQWQVQAFAFVSSISVVGRPRELPIGEAHPTAPASAYAASKLHGEQLTELAARRGLKAASLRVTSPIGPGMASGRIVSAFVERALAGEELVLAGRGGRRQDYVDVRDVAAAALACLAERASGVFNVAAGASISNAELARTCVEELASPSQIVLAGDEDPDEDVAWEVSIDRARTELGYEPRRDLRDSLQAVADDLRRRGAAGAGRHMTARGRPLAPRTRS
jgi:nucleoside-diphosphate-sugar epimerase